VIDKIKPTFAIRTKVRHFSSETEPTESASVFFGDLNGYEILIAQSVDNQDFGGKLCHERSIIKV
jgi:hypothetical protein